MFIDSNGQVAGQSSINGSPRSSIRSNHSSKATTPPPLASNRTGIVIDALNVSPKAKVKGPDNVKSASSNKIVSNSNSKMQQEQVLQQIIDQQALEKQKCVVQLLHANKSIEALGVLVQYLVFNLDAFSCPSLKKSQQKSSKKLLEAREYIDEMKSSYQSLEEKLNERETCISELQKMHHSEMAKAKENQELADEKFNKSSKEFEKKLNDRDVELQLAKERECDLLKRIQALTITENELREKVHSSELEFSEKLNCATLREKDLIEKINQLSKLLEELKLNNEAEKRELEEKLNLTQDELTIMRNTRNTSINESFHNKSLNTSHSQILQDEIESLRCVLELKQSEISELRKTNCELQRTADDAIASQIKCSALESRVEDLQVQLQAKHEEEKEMLQKQKQLQEQYDSVQKKSTRLSLHNEELQWRLKQNAERYSVTINELSKSYQESSFSNRTNPNMSELDVTGKSLNDECEDDTTVSPPASPIIKGVVEKSDSVSWVLEMDDETPEVLATRMVRRAGSFRSDKCSPSPVPKRQKCQSNTSIQQSASATSILRQQSEPARSVAPTNGRLRSKSISTSKAQEDNKAMPHIVRSMSNNGTVVKNLSETAWKHPSLNMTTSSPNPKKSSVTDELIIDEDFGSAAVKADFFLNAEDCALKERESFHRDTAPHFKKSRENRGLITCDTAILASGTVELKKHRRPKASAGEAMISGSNSEDEEYEEQPSFSSSSSTVSTGPSTPSMSSSTSNSSHAQPIESIENVLMRWKEHGNTPMEVSWMEEGEPSESIV